RVLSAAPRVLPVHRVLEAQAGRVGFGRDARVLRAAQLASGLTGHRGREAPRDLRRGRRVRPLAAVLLRLLGEPSGVAPLARAPGQGSHAALQEPGAEVGPDTDVPWRTRSGE